MYLPTLPASEEEVTHGRQKQVSLQQRTDGGYLERVEWISADIGVGTVLGDGFTVTVVYPGHREWNERDKKWVYSD